MDGPALAYLVALAAVVVAAMVTIVRGALRRDADGPASSLAWTGAPASRDPRLEVVEVTWLSHEVSGTRQVTRLSVRHSARLPYVVQLEGGKVACYDKKGYAEWVESGGDPRCVPLPVQQLCDTHLLQRLQSVRGLKDIQGLIAIEPGRIVALEDEPRLGPRRVKRLAGVLLALADELESPQTARDGRLELATS